MIKIDGNKPYKIADKLGTYSTINLEVLKEKIYPEFFEENVPGNVIEIVRDAHVFAIECGFEKPRKIAAGRMSGSVVTAPPSSLV